MGRKSEVQGRGSVVGWQPRGGPGLDFLPPGLTSYRAGDWNACHLSYLGDFLSFFSSVNDSSCRLQPSCSHT